MPLAHVVSLRVHALVLNVCVAAVETPVLIEEGEEEELEAQGEVQEAGKRVTEARHKAKWETHFVKQDMVQQSDNDQDFGYERAAVGHDKPAL